MSDNPKKRGKPDRIRIAVTQPHELRYWSRALGISQVRLRRAVKDVGPMVANVKRYLIRQIEQAR